MPGSPEMTPTCPEPVETLLPHLGKQRTFYGSVYHRGKRRPLRTLEPAFAGRKRLCTPGLDRLLYALEGSPTKRRIDERSRGQLVSA